MRRATLVGALFVGTGLVGHAACGGGGGGGDAARVDAGAGAPDASMEGSAEASADVLAEASGDAIVDAGDSRCATQAKLLGTHPHAKQQPTPLGKTISDVRGWQGRLYFAYGDLEQNTGPIYITTFDPKTSAWTEHPIAYTLDGVVGSTPAFYTHDIERFLPIGDSLWAPAAQPVFADPFDAATAPEYAIATGSNDWKQVDFVPNSIHLVDAIERAPGDVYFTGSTFMSTDSGVGPVVNGRAGGTVWRSVDGGPFAQLFPDFDATTPTQEFFDLTGAWIFGGTLGGVVYLDEDGYIYQYDGGGPTLAPDFLSLGEFLTPTTFAGKILFADLGQFFSFDGTTRENLNFRFFASEGRYQASMEPLALFQVTEGRLLAVAYGGDVMMTKDLVTWTCIGQAPADASAIGSLDGVVYFGSVHSGVYGFPAASW